MAKPFDALGIMNKMAGAAHQKAQPKDQGEPDADDMPPAKKKGFPPKKAGPPSPNAKPSFGKK